MPQKSKQTTPPQKKQGKKRQKKKKTVIIVGKASDTDSAIQLYNSSIAVKESFRRGMLKFTDSFLGYYSVSIIIFISGEDKTIVKK